VLASCVLIVLHGTGAGGVMSCNLPASLETRVALLGITWSEKGRVMYVSAGRLCSRLGAPLAFAPASPPNYAFKRTAGRIHRVS
jgi:hypothetical protein